MARRDNIIDRIDVIDAAPFSDAAGRERAALRDELRADVYAPVILDKMNLAVTFSDLVKALRALDRATPVSDPLNPPPDHEPLITELTQVAHRKFKAYSR